MIHFGVPRLAVAGLSGDSGKTLLSLGLGRCLVNNGLTVRAFKKGPDYIDAAWLAAATRTECRNLDTFLMSEAAIGASLATAEDADLVLIEGNRGLYDGSDAAGTHSTANLAKLVAAPVLLVVDVTKMTRTTAALVLGCQQIDPGLKFAGVVLNRVGTARQETLIRRAVKETTGLPVLGALPRLRGDDPLPGRHLGLVTAAENPRCEEAIERAASAVKQHLDLNQLLTMLDQIPEAVLPHSSAAVTPVRFLRGATPAPVTIGVFSDPAFSFYYPENLERLRAGGAEIIAVSPRNDSQLPALDGLYIGGGFPEVHAGPLAANLSFTASLRDRVANGLPVYAECGGLMYLARQLEFEGAVFYMAGILDLELEQTKRPQGHGYVVAKVCRNNPFFALGTELKGHEFHYSAIQGGADQNKSVLELSRGTGTGRARDGIVCGRVWASYLHLNATATPGWADGFLHLASQHASEQKNRASEPLVGLASAAKIAYSNHEMVAGPAIRPQFVSPAESDNLVASPTG